MTNEYVADEFVDRQSDREFKLNVFYKVQEIAAKLGLGLLGKGDPDGCKWIIRDDQGTALCAEECASDTC